MVVRAVLGENSSGIHVSVAGTSRAVAHAMRTDNFTIVIDAGHGGREDRGRSTAFGARGPSGLLEKDVTLGLARRVARELGPCAVLTRDSDINLSLAERVDVAARHGARAFVSLHANAAGERRRGAETWVHRRAGASSRALATSLGRELAVLGDHGAGVHRGDLALLSPDHLPGHTAACLVEVDYLSDPDGEALLGNPQALDRVARAVARGLDRYRSGEPLSSTAGFADFWAVWCVNENSFLGEIFLSRHAAEESARRHVSNFPEHRARAILVQMGNDLDVRAADARPSGPSTLGATALDVTTLPEVNIQAIHGPANFNLPDYTNTSGNIVITVTPPPPTGTQRPSGALSLMGTVTNTSGVAVEMRCSLLGPGSREVRTTVVQPRATQDFSFDFPNCQRVQQYSFVLSLTTSDSSIRVNGSLTVMMVDS